MLFFEHALRDLAIIALLIVFAGNVTARALRSHNLRWTWALLGLPVGFLFILAVSLIAFPVWAASLYACALGRRWHRQDLENGADHAELARGRLGIVGMLRRRQAEVAIKDHGWIRDDGLIVGRDEQGMPAPIPIGFTSGSHTLVVGATGSGKTVSEAWIACRLIDRFHGAVVIDPREMICSATS
jgi:hypothetical protein